MSEDYQDVLNKKIYKHSTVIDVGSVAGEWTIVEIWTGIQREPKLKVVTYYTCVNSDGEKEHLTLKKLLESVNHA